MRINYLHSKLRFYIGIWVPRVKSVWKKLFCPEPTAINEIEKIKSINVLVKRDDLNHPVIQGNKLRKLKYNFKYFLDNDFSTIATFGGAFSNHIVATAQASKLLNSPCIGFIRGDELENNPHKWSPTLVTANRLGMKLFFLSRQEYRHKDNSKIYQKLASYSSEKIYVVPEGGSNSLALLGVQEIIDELEGQIKAPDYIVCACGTGGTLAGLIDGIAQKGWRTQVIGIAVLKGAQFLTQEVVRLSQGQARVDWQIIHDYHGGGYAKTTALMKNFGHQFVTSKNIPLEKIYTLKSFYATYDLIERSYFEKDSTVVILHTGGLQGGM